MVQNLPLTSDTNFLVIDDHELILTSTVTELKKAFPDVNILTADTAQLAFQNILEFDPTLVLLDLSIPSSVGDSAKTEVGLRLLEKLMDYNKFTNITILSSHLQRLITLVHRIENHEGGFTVSDKSLSLDEIITRVDWSLNGITHTKEITGFRSGIELRPEWYEVLKLAFEAGLQDKAIAEKMSISVRTVRLYFSKLQDVLGIYPEDNDGQLNLRVQTGIKARKMGLIEDVVSHG